MRIEILRRTISRRVPTPYFQTLSIAHIFMFSLSKSREVIAGAGKRVPRLVFAQVHLHGKPWELMQNCSFFWSKLGTESIHPQAHQPAGLNGGQCDGLVTEEKPSRQTISRGLRLDRSGRSKGRRMLASLFGVASNDMASYENRICQAKDWNVN